MAITPPLLWSLAGVCITDLSDGGIKGYGLDFLKKQHKILILVNGTVVRSHACASGYKKDSAEEEGLGRSKGGFTTKIHAMVDALGNPVRFILTSGNRHDVTQAEGLIYGVSDAFVLADKAYDSQKFRETIKNKIAFL